MKKRLHPNHDGKERDRRTRRLTTALWFCIFALFAAASSETEEEKEAPEEAEGAGWFGDADTVVESPVKGGTGPAESAPSAPVTKPSIDRPEPIAKQSQPKPVNAKPADVAASGNAFGIKLTDLLIQLIPERESYAENLEELRLRVEAIEAEVFKGVVEAAKSTDPVGKLSQARADLGEAVKLLQSKDGHEPGRCATKLRESIGAERQEIESKVVTSKAGRSKDSYLKILSALESSMEKLDGIDKDLAAVSSLTERLERELKEIMDVYIDMKRFNGEAEAKAELLDTLTEKEKEWFPDQSVELSTTDNSDIKPDATRTSAGTDEQPPQYTASGPGATPKIVSIRKIGEWNERLQVYQVYFYSGSSVIGDSQQREPVKAMAPIVKEAVEAGCRVEIRGFSDASGTASRNKDIAEARANAVGIELRRLGVVNSWSVSAEIDASANVTDRKGRRVEVRVVAP
jgi:outer membrane protein OmpA-like peptidoglycan-associated protein